MRRIAIGLALIALAGCATVGNQSLASRNADWPPLIMTQAELIKELGRPNSMTTTVRDGHTLNVLVWTYARAEMNPAIFIPIIGLFVAASGTGMDSESRVLSVTFNTEGTMTSRTWSQHQMGSPDRTP